VRTLLQLRAAHHPLFAQGSYIPLAAHGPLGEHVVAFARRLHPLASAPLSSPAAIIVVPRLTHAFAPTAPPMGELWRDTALHLPSDLADHRWRDAISGRELTLPPHASTDPASPIAIPISSVLATAPVAVLVAIP
jgi:(1->4)-alpha-D-glucan 1-alpha-D-glucosylmutase